MKINGKKRCGRCSRTIPRCGEEHWIVLDRMGEPGIDFQRICCTCVDELETLGSTTIVLAGPSGSAA